MSANKIRTFAAASGVIIAGMIAGTFLRAAADESASPKAAPTLDTYQQELPQLHVLGNGKTVGDWRLDTPRSQRPDYIPTRLADGTPGYIKFSDAYGDPDPWLSDRATDGQTVNDLQQKDTGLGSLKPNGKGEIWAPVYAADGQTVIGQQLVADTIAVDGVAK